jgi:hypothetical protein
MVTDAGAAGTFNAKFDSFDALRKLFPQSEVYNTRTLSPATAAALEVNVTVNILDVNDPESIVIVDDKLPTNDHT